MVFFKKVTILIESGELWEKKHRFYSRVVNTRSKNDNPYEGKFEKLTEGPYKNQLFYRVPDQSAEKEEEEGGRGGDFE